MFHIYLFTFSTVFICENFLPRLGLKPAFKGLEIRSQTTPMNAIQDLKNKKIYLNPVSSILSKNKSKHYNLQFKTVETVRARNLFYKIFIPEGVSYLKDLNLENAKSNHSWQLKFKNSKNLFLIFISNIKTKPLSILIPIN